MLDPLIEHPLTLRLGWTLAHSLWQGALLAAVLGAALRLVDQKRSALRHGLALATLLAWLAAPLATFTLLGAEPAGPSSSVASSAAMDTPLATTGSRSDPSAPAGSPEAVRTGATAASKLASIPATSRLLPYAALAWLVTAALLTLRMLGGLAWVQRLRRQGHPIPHLEETLQALAARLGITRPVRLLTSTRVDAPAAFGWLRPVVLVPASAITGLSTQQLELVIAHELAHIRRHDYLVNVLQGAAEALLFYHPVTWWLSRTLRLEREHACDDLALRTTSRAPLELAETLARLEGARPVPVPALAANGHLAARVRRLLRADSIPPARTPALLPLLAVLTLFTWLALATGQAATPEGLFERQPEGAFESPYSDPPEVGWPTHRSPLDLIFEAPFLVQGPTYVPAGYVFANAVWNPQDQTTSMTFGASSIGDPRMLDSYLTLTQTPVENARPMPIGTDAVVEPVMVGDATAGYVAGGWEYAREAGVTGSSPTWQPDAHHLLAWQQDDMVYVLGAYAGSEAPPSELERGELVRMAESLVAMLPPPSVHSDRVQLPTDLARHWATLQGTASFGPDFGTLAGLAEGSSLTIEERSPDGARRVIVTPSASDGFEYAYREDGQPAEFDEDARAWYERLLKAIVLEYVVLHSGLEDGGTYSSLRLHADRYELFMVIPERRTIPLDFGTFLPEDLYRGTISTLERAFQGVAHGLVSPSALEVVIGYHLGLAPPTPETESSLRYAVEFLEPGAGQERMFERLGTRGE